MKLGNVRVANMLILGFYLARKKIVKPDTVLKVIAEIAPADKKGLVGINQQALKQGYQLK
jgi:2-oxoglutarate ferredoxin oxidoreductase subunit gamma